ncbi:hypothetical protein RHMOL_Rhmol01G0027000 [Rhododendron molle]|uniref:Uncharacterized protein n=1 Tax=Rhododendron molle TaxID=49168 RepID=A0ACC0PZ91_RHOML|nr:hypothetical protein RHMOL_Rhmol01G0027000 [Rhododendron molle]
MKKQRSGPSGYFPDDCWELIFRKMRENNERELDSISLVSKQFLSISNRVKLSLNGNHRTLPLLPNLLRRFRHIKTIVIDIKSQKDIDGLVDQISRSGVLNLQVIEFRQCMTEPPRHGFKALALNKNIKNNLKVLNCSAWTDMQDNDLVSIADCFPLLEELRISAYTSKDNHEVAGRITDDDVFGSYSDHSILNLKTLKAQDTQIDDEGMAMIGKRCRNLQYLDIGNCKKVTDKGVIEVVRNCERLRDILMGGCEKVGASIVLQMVSSRPSLRNIEPPCFDDLSEQMIDKVSPFGCLLIAIRLWLSS